MGKDREGAAVFSRQPAPNVNYVMQARTLFVALVTLVVIFSIPFFRSSNSSWAAMNPYLQGMTLSLAAALLCQAYFSFRLGNALMLLMVSFTISLAAESMGIRWAWPFGSQYHYNSAIGPTLPGGVPLCIPVTWFMLAYTAIAFLGPFSVRPGGLLSYRRVLLKAALCALFITAADFVIDPLAVRYEAWSWHQPGGYFDVPYGNYAGWFFVAFLICGVTILLEKPRHVYRYRDHISQDVPFAVTSISLTSICLEESVIRTGSALPVALALTVMAPCWLYWLASLIQSRRGAVRFQGRRIEKIGEFQRVQEAGIILEREGYQPAVPIDRR